MGYIKHWANDEKLNETEKAKLAFDGLQIYDEIPKYAKEGFAAIPKDQWPMFKWAGLYLQKPKEDGYFMMRVCVPAGILNYEQVVTLAGIARDYGRGIFDITTRQAVQFHWLRIEEIPDILDRMKQVDLSTAGACGDITRNIMGNPLAGIDPEETMDTRPIVEEVYRYFQFNPEFSNLPRKYKMSISANTLNSAHAEINCVSFIPARKEIAGERVAGFHVKVGGGLSSRPFLAEELDVFIRPEEVNKVAIAITTIFRDHGYRQKRTRSRLKFLMADWGPEQMKAKLLTLTGPLPPKGESQLKSWNAGYFYGVHPQKQAGLRYIGLNVPVGRLQAEEVLELAHLSKTYGNGEIRNCHSQNLIIPHVPEQKVDDLLADPIFDRIRVDPPHFMGYAVSCTGIEYCNLALTETKERMRHLAAYLDEQLTIDVPVRIHMVGCPNSCGQRQIADIGLQGIKMKAKEKKGLIEAFEMYVGGTLLDGGRFNEKLKGKIAGEHLPDVLRHFLTYFQEKKQVGETFLAFVDRVGKDHLQEVLDHILSHRVPQRS